MMKGEFFVVDYKIQDETKYSDIISSDKIRSPNKNGPIQHNFLPKVSFQVPDDLKDVYVVFKILNFFLCLYLNLLTL